MMSLYHIHHIVKWGKVRVRESLELGQKGGIRKSGIRRDHRIAKVNHKGLIFLKLGNLLIGKFKPKIYNMNKLMKLDKRMLWFITKSKRT